MRKALMLLGVAALAGCAGSGIGANSTTANSPLAPLPMTAERSVQSVAASVAWTVGTGASTQAYALQNLDFYPNKITINAGDTITWQVASGVGGDAHTISFLAPGQSLPSPLDPKDLIPAGGNFYDGTAFTSSGIKLGGQSYTLRFPKTGTFPYFCLFHEPAMEGTVVVQKAGTPYPKSMATIMHENSLDIWTDLNAGASSISLFPFRNYGTTLAAGISPGLTSRPPSQSTVLRYLRTNLPGLLQTGGNVTIKVGTTLTWVNQSNNEPHTITFGPAGSTGIPNIPPDPAVGGNTFDGTHIVNSGSLIPGQKFSLKFTKPGTYFYGCIYHANSRMTGTITVTS